MNKTKRHSIYIAAKAIYMENRSVGICRALDVALKEIGVLDNRLFFYNDIFELFPELEHVKPEGAKAYWWPLEDTESRIKAFDTIIKLSEDEQ